MTRGVTIGTWMLAATLAAAAPAAADGDPKLLGAVSVDALHEAPYDAWYVPEHDAYVPDPGVVEALRAAVRDDLSVTVFLGTWCGDSRREVPRLLKVLEAVGLPEDRVRLVAVDNAPDAIKRSPDGEEVGLEIYRVPTAILLRDGREVSRLVEHPVRSVERDLLAMLDGTGYEPAYRTYPTIRRWLDDGVLADANVSARGLAADLRHRLASEGELAAAARVLLSRGQTREAIKLYEINCDVFGESADAFARLAEARATAGDREAARRAAERALRLNSDPSRTNDLVELLESTLPPEGVKSLP